MHERRGERAQVIAQWVQASDERRMQAGVRVGMRAPENAPESDILPEHARPANVDGGGGEEVERRGGLAAHWHRQSILHCSTDAKQSNYRLCRVG